MEGGVLTGAGLGEAVGAEGGAGGAVGAARVVGVGVGFCDTAIPAVVLLGVVALVVHGVKRRVVARVGVDVDIALWRQELRVEALGRQVSGDARVNYDYNTAYQSWQELDLLATSAENRGDEKAAARYSELRDSMVTLSPMLAAPYFDAEKGNVDIARYEADTYLVEITGLQERFLASSLVKDAWDGKANTYIVHLTLLAVSLFLFGMSVMVSGSTTRWIFATTGIGITLVAVIWADAREAADAWLCAWRRYSGDAADWFDANISRRALADGCAGGLVPWRFVGAAVLGGCDVVDQSSWDDERAPEF